MQSSFENGQFLSALNDLDANAAFAFCVLIVCIAAALHFAKGFWRAAGGE